MNSRRWTQALLLLGVTGAGLGLRLFGLTRQGFWTDELYVVYEARQPLNVLFDPHLHVHHPPGYRLALHVWLGVSLEEWWIRLLPALAGTALVPVMWLLARALWPGSRWAAWVAALFGATSPFLLHYGQDVTAYSWTVLWVAVSVLLLVHAWRCDRGWLWVAWGASLAVVMYSHYFSVFPLAAEGVAVLVAGVAGGRESRGRLARGLLGILGAAALFAPWVWVLFTYGRDAYGVVLFPLSVDRQLFEWAPVMLAGYARQRFWTLGMGFTLVWVGLAMAGAWAMWRLAKSRDLGRTAGAALVVGWGVAAWLGPYLFLRATTPPGAVDPVRFAAMSVPALLLGVAAVVATLPVPVRVVAIGAWLALVWVQWGTELGSPPKQDWRGVMGTIAAEARPDDALLAFTAFHAGAAAAYYPIPVPVQGGWFVPGCEGVRGEGAAFWFPEGWRWRAFLDPHARCSLDLRGEIEKRVDGAGRVWYLAGDGVDGTYPRSPAAERVISELGWRGDREWHASPLVLRLYVRSAEGSP